MSNLSLSSYNQSIRPSLLQDTEHQTCSHAVDVSLSMNVHSFQSAERCVLASNLLSTKSKECNLIHLKNLFSKIVKPDSQ
jgi:hypothetical protein